MKSVYSFLRFSILWLSLSGLAFSAELSVATLNAYHLFAPAENRSGRAAEANRYDQGTYEAKIANLSSLLSGVRPNVVGLEEVGGKEEVRDLAAKAGPYQYGFVKGRDTYTGQNVGIMLSLPEGYNSRFLGRVPELDRALSKHSLVRITATDTRRPLYLLVVHLIRPIGTDGALRHESQLISIQKWVEGMFAENPNAVVVVLGDTNSREKGKALFSGALDLLAANDYPGTHLDGSPYDRIMVFGQNVRAGNLVVTRPPYGKRPNDLNKLLWSDHFLVSGTIRWE